MLTKFWHMIIRIHEQPKNRVPPAAISGYHSVRSLIRNVDWLYDCQGLH